MTYGLPTTVEIDGKQHAIRTDFRVILEIFEVLNDPGISSLEKCECVCTMFYLAPEEISDSRVAIEKCFEFIDGGEYRKQDKKTPRLIDWEKDFEYIIAPVNRVLGTEARAIAYDPDTNEGGLHWWTFLSAFMEIGGDCTFSQIVNIRDKRARNKPLSKDEKKWAARNQDIVSLPKKYSLAEDALVDEWTKGVNE